MCVKYSKLIVFLFFTSIIAASISNVNALYPCVSVSTDYDNITYINFTLARYEIFVINVSAYTNPDTEITINIISNSTFCLSDEPDVEYPEFLDYVKTNSTISLSPWLSGMEMWSSGGHQGYINVQWAQYDIDQYFWEYSDYDNYYIVIDNTAIFSPIVRNFVAVNVTITVDSGFECGACNSCCPNDIPGYSMLLIPIFCFTVLGLIYYKRRKFLLKK